MIAENFLIFDRRFLLVFCTGKCVVYKFRFYTSESVCNNLLTDGRIRRKMKKIIRTIQKEFIYGGHLTSLAAVGILTSVTIIFNQEISAALLLAGYSISQIVYVCDRYKKTGEDSLTNPERVKHIENLKKHFLVLMVFYLSIFLFFLTKLENLEAILVILFIGLGGWLFTDIFKGFTVNIVGFKNFYTAFFWAWLVFLAGFYYHLPLGVSLISVFMFVFLRILLDTVFCDIKDMDSDKREKLKTFPVFFGEKKTLMYLHVVNAVSFLPIILGVWLGWLPLFSLALLFFYFYGFYYLNKIKEKKADARRLSYTLVDGEQLFWPLALFLGRLFI